METFVPENLQGNEEIGKDIEEVIYKDNEYPKEVIRYVYLLLFFKTVNNKTLFQLLNSTLYNHQN